MISKGRTMKHRLAFSLFIIMVIITVSIAIGADKVPFPQPASHKGNWVENHGFDARLNINEAGQPGTACLTCHEKNDCIACHTMRLPRDHNNYWRIQGHGITASVNRERCLACHRQDYCIRCHNETAPRSHTAGWINRHCQWCHLSGKVPGGNCGVCHKTSPH
jgi:hypothetical protein